VVTKNVRVNEQIRISPIRLIDADGGQVGIVPIEEARQLARERELDLVEVAATARPPVCRIMDYGKYRYRENKKAKEAKKKQHVIQMKELKLRSKIDEHDLQFKLRHVRRFLEKHSKVKLTMVFRGREVVHKELGEQVLHRVLNEVTDIALIEGQIKMEGRNMIMILTPKVVD
jgi:translation initiation factor IF-3